MESRSNRILITGISGFTGKYLESSLASADYKVYGVGNKLSEVNDHTFNCDILDTPLLTSIIEKVNPDYVIHLAAISFVQHENLSEIYETNILGTESLLKSVVLAKVKPIKILIASSATVYGDQPDPILSEEMPPNPKNHYGISKWGMEQVSKNYFNKIPIIITRTFNYSGPGQSVNFVIPKIIDHFKTKSDIIELGNLNVFREFNDVNFICKVYIELLLSSFHSGIVNVCSGKAYSLQEVLNEAKEISNHNLTIAQNPKFMRSDEIIHLTGSTMKLLSIIKKLPETSIKKTVSSFF